MGITSTLWRARRVAALTSILMLCFGGVSLGGVDVGADGGGATGSWLHGAGAGCLSLRREFNQGYHEAARASAHVDVDLPTQHALTLGGAAGFFLTDAQEQGAVFTRPDIVSPWSLESSSNSELRRVRGWAGVRFGFEFEHLQGRVMLGAAASFGGRAGEDPAHPVMDWEIQAGWPGIASYSASGEWFSGLRAPLYAVESSTFHGVRVGGGDWPAGEVGGRFGLDPVGGVSARLELAFVSPRHWVLQPWVRGGLDAREPESNWAIRGGLTVRIGAQARFSERVRGGP